MRGTIAFFRFACPCLLIRELFVRMGGGSGIREGFTQDDRKRFYSEVRCILTRSQNRVGLGWAGLGSLAGWRLPGWLGLQFSTLLSVNLDDPRKGDLRASE